MSPLIFPLAVTGLVIVIAFAYALFAPHLRIIKMPDFTALKAENALLAATVVRVQSAFAALSGPALQASIDEATASVKSANDALSTLAPVPVVAPLAVTPTSLTVTAGQPISDQLTVSNGTPPYAYVAADGLVVDAGGLVSGVPTAATTPGEKLVTVTDAAGATVTVTAA